MAFSQIALTAAWPSEPSFTATGDTSVLIVNLNERDSARITWAVTEDDTVPTVESTLGAPIRPTETQALSLKTGERLWIAAPGAGAGTLPASLMTGAA